VEYDLITLNRSVENHQLTKGSLLLVGLKPTLAIHCFMTFGVMELIFHLSSFRNSAESGVTGKRQ